jgi:hypothetical protein
VRREGGGGDLGERRVAKAVAAAVGVLADDPGVRGPSDVVEDLVSVRCVGWVSVDECVKGHGSLCLFGLRYVPHPVP